MKPLKVEAVKLFTEVPNRSYLMNGQKDFKKKSLESKLPLSLLTRSTQSPNSNFSLQSAFYRNERYLFVT